jgi:hypothetical protein
MKTMDLFWTRPHSWALIFTGDGRRATVTDGKFIAEELHEGMCCCKASAEACGDESVKGLLEEMKDSANWTFDNHGEPFEFGHDFEDGGVQVIRIAVIKRGGVEIR